MFRAFLSTVVLLAAVGAPGKAQQIPATLENLKPHEIVEAITSESKTLGLSRSSWAGSIRCTSPCGTSGTTGSPARATRPTPKR